MPKHIPLPVVDEMKKNFTLPHEDEGNHPSQFSVLIIDSVQIIFN